MSDKNVSVYDSDLNQVLAKATNEDLDPLVEYLLQKGEWTEMLSLSERYKQFKPDHQKYIDEISEEIRKFGGHTLLNIARDIFGKDPVSYHEIVRDVADHVKAPYSKNADIASVEYAILLKTMEKAWEKMSEDERKAFLDSLGINYIDGIPKAMPFVAMQAAIRVGGFAAYQLALTIANAIAKLILGRGLPLVVNAGLARAMAVFAGPIGWAITGLWMLADIAGPAYRVTVPCVIHIAMLRQKQLLSYCPKCSCPYSGNPKFCPECGEKLD